MKGKTIFCNCDDPKESNFFKYFAQNFSHLGLKKLITTHYHESRKTYKLEITGDMNDDGKINNDDIVKTPLKQNGDFRSPECIEILQESDIVITNPPFSLFREYVAQLVEYEKDFLIIGNVNAVTYKEIFPLIAQNKMWLGPSITSGDRKFNVPKGYPLTAATSGIDKDGRPFVRVKGVRWFTTLDHNKRHEKLILYKKYTSEEYPKYDNYDAINVNKVAEIPCDYDGVMGVPITFLDKYNPEQFEIVAFRKGDDGKDLVYSLNRSEGKRERERERESSTVLQNTHPTMAIDGLMNNPKDTKVNGKSKYARILIRQLP